jgi:contact-dependent growth inhibition (CDI) system CdiI-like immunity protein
MTRGAASEFPALERVFSGYLHEDFVAEYSSPEAALRAFRNDASPAEWRRFQREAKRFAGIANGRDFDDVRRLFQKLGSHWTPPSRDALLTLLTGAADLKRSGSR